MKDELDRKIMAELATLKPKTYRYLTDDNNKNQKAIDAKKYVIKRRL